MIILVYGFTRLQIAKDLGFSTVPMIVSRNGKDEFQECPIGEIILKENTRQTIKKDDDYMAMLQDIKQRGIQTPLRGIYTKDYERFSSLRANLLENVHRRGYSPVELGLNLRKFITEGYNITQISKMLSLPRNKVRTALELVEAVPKEYHQELDYKMSKVDNGSISASVASRITFITRRFHFTEKETKELWKAAKNLELKSSDIGIIGLLLSEGVPIDEAIRARVDYKEFHPKIVVHRERAKRLVKEEGISLSEIFRRELSKTKMKGIFYQMKGGSKS